MFITFTLLKEVQFSKPLPQRPSIMLIYAQDRNLIRIHAIEYFSASITTQALLARILRERNEILGTDI
jgi:hypothetical protein